MVRRILYALLALGPMVVALDAWTEVSENMLFVLSALALIPLAWLIGEATEHAAHHTGPGIGGFLNATFGNAPELIIALIAVKVLNWPISVTPLWHSFAGGILALAQ